MMTPKLGLALALPVESGPAESRQKDHMIVAAIALGPMPLQDVMETHGYQIYPQQLLRLVGCHEIGCHEISPATDEGSRWWH